MDSIEIEKHLNEKGFVHLQAVLSKEECQMLQGLYTTNSFRSVINMQRYRFGKGEYKYFSYPLPQLLQRMRAEFYKQLAPIANRWMNMLCLGLSYPDNHADFIKQCHDKGQLRPTPLILRYEEGGFNTLHQDLYGEVYFPFQVVFILTEPEVDHRGGELVFVEQLPRAQSKAEVLSPGRGDAVIFTTNFRPVQGARRYYRAKMKHGVSPVRSGVRMALGIIFHDGA
ncbi:MAG TPA: 2OG-Fe(II) oxygenase [Chryseosolibacter sp.]